MNLHLAALVPDAVDEDGYGADGGNDSDSDDEQHAENQAVVEPIQCPLNEENELTFKTTIAPIELHELECWATAPRKVGKAFTCFEELINAQWLAAL